MKINQRLSINNWVYKKFKNKEKIRNQKKKRNIDENVIKENIKLG
jgi:hypothetical protein